MPIVEIEAVGLAPGDIGPARVQRTADALGQALGVAPGKVWLRVRTLPRGAYAENGTAAAATPAPVFVRVLLASLPGADDLEREVAAVTRAVAASFGRPEAQVHVEVAAPGFGRIAFGGQLSA